MSTYDITDRELNSSLDALIVAMCRDYKRRESAIRAGELSRRTLMEYRYLDYRIFDGAADVVGCEDALIYIDEIGNKIGYANTALEVSERTYKERKAAVKRSIARKLHLCD